MALELVLCSVIKVLIRIKAKNTFTFSGTKLSIINSPFKLKGLY